MKLLIAMLYLLCVGTNGYMWAISDGATAILWGIATFCWAAGAGLWMALAIHDEL